MKLALLIALASTADPATSPDPAAFPVPAEKGMSLDAKATEFHVPFGFAHVERFYRQQFAGRKDIAFARSEEEGQPVLTIRSLRKADRWTKATIHTDGSTCHIRVTRVVVAAEVNVSGELPPVQFVIGRSRHVNEQLDSIDHAQR